MNLYYAASEVRTDTLSKLGALESIKELKLSLGRP